MTVKKLPNKIKSKTQSYIDFELWVILDNAHSALSRARELELAQFGITLEQAAVLYALERKGGSATNAEIADIIIRQYNSVTTLINRMAKLGLVTKEKSSNHRNFVVSLTPKGKDKNKYRKKIAKSIHMAFLDFSPSDKLKLLSFLSRVVKKSRGMLLMDSKLPFLS